MLAHGIARKAVCVGRDQRGPRSRPAVGRRPPPLTRREAAYNVASMNRYEFELNLSPERYLHYYRGTVRHIIVRCSTGQTVQFPASLVQRFVSPEGVHGSFVLTCDEKNKCLGLERMP